jgi:hypothetical protein
MQYIAWPIAVAIIVIVAMFLFRSPVKNFIDRLRSVKTGGLALGTESQDALPPASKTDLSIVSAQSTIDSLTNVIQEFAAQAAQAQLRVHLSEIEKAELIKEATGDIAKVRRETLYWWCKYLSVFFVAQTKLTLLIIQTNPNGTSHADLENIMVAYIEAEEQRLIVKNVLLESGLIIDDGAIFKATRHANFFIEFDSTGKLNVNLLTN